MNIINWAEHNGETFQAFCNDLLSFEFGRNYIPFSAPGKDKGVDGLFEGNYNGKKGKWRIQAKFRHPETGRSTSIAQLKSQIKSDLERNVQDEQYVLFITNVEIGANQYKEIKKFAKESTEVEFDIWDGAKINTLLTRHPIVRLWYSSDAKHLIEGYSTYFRDELHDDTDSLYTFSSTFYYREKNLQQLDQFVKSDDKIASIISGVPGIGKTRLCVEFFGRVESNQDWKGLVIISHKIDFQLLRMALQGERNYLLLVDDADKFEEKDLVDLLTIVKGIDTNKVKVLFTVRSYFLEKVRNQFSPDDLNKRITQISIENLTPEETVKLLESELRGFSILEHVGYLANQTQGIPLVINTLIRVIKGGARLSDISKDTLLQHYINQLLDRFRKHLSEEYEIKQRNINKLISLIALIEPIQLNDQDLINTIANTEDISNEEIEIVFNQLRSQKLVSGHFEYSIKPDVYSDLILEKSIKSSDWISKKVNQYGNFISHIIKNIAYVESEEHSKIFNNLLQEYVTTIDQCTDKYALTRILETVYLITFLRPALALNSVKKVINIFENQNHPLYNEFEANKQNKNYSLDYSFNNLKSILSSLFEVENFLEQAYYWSGKLYLHTKDEGVITNIARFSKSDNFNGFNCVLQQRILKQSKQELLSEKKQLKLFALKSINAILKLQFTDSESHPYQKHSIQLYTFSLPNSKEIKRLRSDSLKILIEAFSNTYNKELQSEIIRMLVDVPREIFSVRDKNQKRNEDITIILNFLKSISKNGDLELSQKHHIRDQLYWYKRWGIDKKFNSIISEIEEGLSSNDLAEILLEFLNPKYDSDLRKERDLFEEQAKELIDSNTHEDLANALLKVINQSEYAPPNFFTFLNIIAADLDKASAFIDYLWEIDKSFLLNYASGMFQKFRFSDNRLDFYWQNIEKLLAEKTDLSRNCILSIYNSRGFTEALLASNKRLEIKDTNTIISVFKSSTEINHFHLSYALPILFSYKREIAQEQLRLYLSQINERYIDNLFFALDEYFEEYYHDIKDLVLENTIHLNITHGIERTLNRIIKEEGFSLVFEYFKKRFAFKKQLLGEKQSILGYDYVPKHGSHSITNDLSEDQKRNLFRQIIEWFSELELQPIEKLYAKDIIDVFRPTNHIDDDLLNLYRNLVSQYSDDSNSILNITNSLSEFENKNSQFVDLIIEILRTSYKNFSDEEIINKIRSQCYISLTSVGVKSGRAGEPFAVDLELGELIKETLRSSKSKDPTITDFFERVLKSVQADIERQTDEEGGEVW